jgi:hypothetical protein
MSTFTEIEYLLLIHSLVIAIILFIIAIQMVHMKLFYWTSAGFWAWIASLLLFVINPFTSIFWNIQSYRTNLALSGGISRGIWVGFLTALALIVFFISYMKTKSVAVTWNIAPQKDEKITLPTAVVMALFLLFASFSLLTYRSNLIQTEQSVVVISGRFAGETTGYEYIAHQFAFVPIFILLLSKSRWTQIVGILLGMGYVLLKMQDAWGRWAVISLLIGASIIFTLKQKRRWPSVVFIAAIALFTVILVLRGHSTVTSGQDFYVLISHLPEQLGPKLASNNTDMLSFWYLKSYIQDQITGYDYGIPFLNYVVAGFLPRRFFPDKYFLIDWLHSQQPVLSLYLSKRLIGAKWSMFGCFYDNGGVIALILLSAGFGWSFRKLDGMLSIDTPILIKAIGISWLSVLWMVWAGPDYWALEVLGTLAIPGLVIWFLTPKGNKQTTKNLESSSARIQNINLENNVYLED